jgi:hypothetical protein
MGRNVMREDVKQESADVIACTVSRFTVHVSDKLDV